MSAGLIIDSQGTYRSLDEINRRHIRDVAGRPQYDAPKDEPRSFEDWQAVMLRRQSERKELEPFVNYAEVKIDTDRPICVAVFGDVHGGGSDVRYDLVGKDVGIVKAHPLMYSMALGDIADAFVWMSAAQDDIISLEEQYHYTRAILSALKERLICGSCGNHEAWTIGAGPISYYHQFTEQFGVPLFDGPSCLKLKVGDVVYTISLAHAFAGSSIYNNAHPEMRAGREMQGADIYIGAHTHRKGIGQQPTKLADMSSIVQTFVSTGTYKASDGYSRKKGFPKLDDRQMGAVFLQLDPHDKVVTPFWTIEQAQDAMEQHMS